MYTQRENKIGYWRGFCTPIVYSSIINNGHNMEITYPSINEWMDRDVV